jgi:Uma2 family endonuclease
MDWLEVTEHPSLRDLPFKIELNEYGAILMNPVKLNHSAYQIEIGYFMRTQRQDGIALAECAIWTPKGTKVADVAWFSAARWLSVKGQTEASIAPEICVEVLSMSNSEREIKGKRKLYFTQGAQEVWTCDPYGKMAFYDAKGKLPRSVMFPDFPDHIEI